MGGGRWRLWRIVCVCDMQAYAYVRVCDGEVASGHGWIRIVRASSLEAMV